MAQEYKIEQLNHGRKVFNFLRYKRWVVLSAGLLIISSLVIIGIRGFNWGLDFSGGTLIEVKLQRSADLDNIRKALIKAGFHDPLVQNFGSNRDVMIRIPVLHNYLDNELGNKIITIINSTLKQNTIIKRIEFIGPSVSNNLTQNSITALLSAFIVILFYIGIRFDWRLSISAILALIHDIIITCGILSLFFIEIDLTIVASLMSVIGYSLNDKIVVFDRIRENFRKNDRGSSYDIINISLTQIFSRTLITSIIILTMILILFIYGGAILKGFSLTMLIGVIIGTISSLYISSSLILQLNIKREHLLIQKVEKEGADQPPSLP